MGGLEGFISGNGEDAGLRNAIYQVRSKMPRPMTPLEITAKLQAQGFDKRVKNLSGRVRATLCMYTEFDKVTRGLYAAGKLPGQYRGSTKDDYVERAQRTRPDVFTLDQIAQITHIPHEFIAKNAELLGTPKPDGTGAYGYTKGAMNKLARRYQRSVDTLRVQAAPAVVQSSKSRAQSSLRSELYAILNEAGVPLTPEQAIARLSKRGTIPVTGNTHVLVGIYLDKFSEFKKAGNAGKYVAGPLPKGH